MREPFPETPSPVPQRTHSPVAVPPTKDPQIRANCTFNQSNSRRFSPWRPLHLILKPKQQVR